MSRPLRFGPVCGCLGQKGRMIWESAIGYFYCPYCGRCDQTTVPQKKLDADEETALRKRAA